jgi:YgiT-type zinc finger domain-containing protein
MTGAVSDLPFKTSDRTIIILKGVPLLQCGNCGEYLIDDAVMSRIDEIVGTVVGAAELEVIQYAA